MAANVYQAGAISITSTPAQLFPDGIIGRWRVWIKNDLAVNEMYVGGAGVTSADGKEVAASADMAADGFECLDPAGLFAVCDGAETTDAQVLAIRVA